MVPAGQELLGGRLSWEDSVLLDGGWVSSGSVELVDEAGSLGSSPQSPVTE
jgi:hypothetical protein